MENEEVRYEINPSSVPSKPLMKENKGFKGQYGRFADEISIVMTTLQSPRKKKTAFTECIT